MTPPRMLFYFIQKGGDSMNYSNYRLTLDINEVRSNIIVKVKRGTNTKRLCISLTENGKVYEIAERCTAVFKGKKPDGKGLLNDCTIEGNVIYYVMENNTTNAVGIVDSEVSLIGAYGKTICSPTFSILVEDNPVQEDDVIDSTNEAGAFVSLVGRVNTAEDKVDDLTGRMASVENRLDNGVDNFLSTNSINPVQNRVITNKINEVESVATEASYASQAAMNEAAAARGLASDAGNRLYYLTERVNTLEETGGTGIVVDDKLDANSTNPVQNKVVAEANANMNEIVTDVANDLSDVKKDIVRYEEEIGRVKGIDSRVAAIEDETIPDLEKRITHMEDTAPIVDGALDIESTNAVQNKAVTESIGSIGGQLASVKDGISALNGRVDDALDLVNDFNGDLGSLTNNVNSLSESVRSIEEQALPDHDERISDLENNALTVNDVDAELSATSENPVQNKVAKAKFDEIDEWHSGMANFVQGQANLVDDVQKRVQELENTDVVNSVNNQKGAVILTASDVGALPSTFTETDPTVPAWAKQKNKPTYTASEVGARASDWMPSASDVGAEKSGAVSTHNTKTDAHNDIRLLITALTTRLDALANSTDEDLDQMAEIVAYIKSNKSLIDQITTSKVSVSDIVNNLTTNVTNKPLSAAQGVALKALIDAITVPTKLSELEADDNNCRVSYTEKSAWNAKSNFSGAYADLTGKPTIPTVPTKVSDFTNDAGYLTDETDPTVPSWAKASSKPSYTKSEVGLGNVDNVKQYSASNPPPYPVTSVNGKTGAVTITVPTKTSELTNNSGFLTSHQDISGKADKSAAETWTFTLEDGSTVTKKVVLA